VILEVRALHAGYDRTRDIVGGVDLSLAAGEIVTIIGQNGAGKSTVLKGIANLIRHRRGEVFLDGDSVFAHSAQHLLRLGLAYIPQGRSLFPQLTVAENIAIGGYILRDRAMVRERAAELEAKFVDLGAMRQTLAGSLSGGQQRMLEIARTLMTAPRVLMLDEPSIGLAPSIVAQVFRLLRQLAAEGVAVLMVEQNVRAALEISDRGYVLEFGRVRLEDQASALLADRRIEQLYMGIRR
jgi:branched-chain amino acid transport system ATP-binding protein